MAGFIISLDKNTNLSDIISSGIYSSVVPENSNSIQSQIITLSTLVDFLSMKENDNVYFFQKRKIYGIGRLKSIQGHCIYNNYQNALDLSNYKCNNSLDGSNDLTKKWICFFEPSPFFFAKGVDMDDVLRYKPNSFRMLRAFENRSFIKIDDEENDALKQFLYLKNSKDTSFFDFSPKLHINIDQSNLVNYKVDMADLIKYNSKNDSVSLEVVLEAFLVNLINNESFLDYNWDYVSHQVIASPFKPLSYIDKMDIFAYKFLEYPHENKPIEKYLVLELKKDSADDQSIEQTMKYVDWICNEYASGDYSAIIAGVVAHNFKIKSFTNYEKNIKRTFIESTHPIVTKEWNNLTCFTYSLEDTNLKISTYNIFNPHKYLIEKLKEYEIKYDKNNLFRNKQIIKPLARIKSCKIIFLNSIEDYQLMKSDSKWTSHYISESDDKDAVDRKLNSLKEVLSNVI